MVHKKYKWKNGKKYGPYYYENKRVGNKVITTYLGRDYKSGDKKSVGEHKYRFVRSYYLIAGMITLILLSLTFYFVGQLPFFSPGIETLNINLFKDSYIAGELLNGEIVLESLVIRDLCFKFREN